ncbi:MAG: STAS/SEC14 domain-containing protein [Melioribacteraceae bacterium]|nr:STAS/SEC14 domain-containing protein [Ignavibacteriota bacterium]MBZ0181582.1 STAS/SEC14 domain-containing protein [Melioribacteraceae bacterium]
MLTINNYENSNMIETVSEGKLDQQDYNKLIPLLEEKINKFGKIRWYFEVGNFDGWTIEAMWSDFKFDIKHRNDFEKIAIVGNKKWHEWMADVLKPFTDAEIKYYENENNSKAKEWLLK